jgi:hypothetical protein
MSGGNRRLAAQRKAARMSPEPETALAPAAPVKTPVRFGMMPTSVDEGWRLATMVAKSEFAPKSLRDKPYDCMFVMQFGAEVGLTPMQSLSSVFTSGGGRCSLYGDAMLGIVVRSPLYVDHDEFYEVSINGVLTRRAGLTGDDLKADSTTAVCVFLRKGKRTPVERRFTIGQARKAGLLGKAGPWSEFPDRMLQMRARSFAARDCFPDLLRGIRSAEEVIDLDESEPAPPLAAVPQVRRLSETPGASMPAGVGAPTAPERDVIEIGPAKVESVERAEDAYIVTLADGHVLETLSPEIAKEAIAFVGTDHLVLFTCAVRGDGDARDILSLVVAV